MRRTAAGLLLVATGAWAEPPPAQEVLGAPAAIGETRGALVRLPARLRLRAQPSAEAPTVAILDGPRELEVVERRGDWIQVRWDDRLLWASPETDPGVAGLPPAPETATAPASSAVADPARLERARAALGAGARSRRLGPFHLLTDLPEGDLLDDLDRVAAQLPAAYGDRFGLDPGDPRELAVVLFREEADYRVYQAAEGVSGEGAGGHATGGAAALFVGSRPAADVRSRLVHELTHLLNRRALGEAPPWLEEAMAGDLGLSRVDRRGRIAPGTVAGRIYDAGGLLVRRDPRAALALLASETAAGRAPSLAELTCLDLDAFARPEGRTLRYLAGTFLLRYLLDGPRAQPEVVRERLAALARGETPGTGWPAAGAAEWADLERRYRRWLRLEASRR